MPYISKYRKNCITCMRTKHDVKLRARIVHATYRRDVGDETLQDISKEMGISFQALYNHSRKHLKEREASLDHQAVRITKKVADIKAAAQKRAELSVDHENISAEPESVIALKEYIAQGHDLVKQGKLNITAQSFLQAVGKDIDYEAKKKDREVDIIKTMMRFASGETSETKKEIKNENDTRKGSSVAAIASGDADTGQDGPSDIHNEDAGDAVAQWAAELSGKYSKAEDPNQPADVQQPLGEIDPDSVFAPVAPLL